jgi:hypothetical protein
MLKITGANLIKQQQFRRNNIDENDETIGQDGQQGAINETNYRDFLSDNLDDPKSGYSPIPEENVGIPDYFDEIPTSNEELGVPEDTKEIVYADSIDLINDGIDNTEIIGFGYTNRHGAYAGWRTVEPHYTFSARTTGNDVLVAFDLDVADIRAFIVGNVHPNGVRYENVKFDPRDEIMSGIY